MRYTVDCEEYGIKKAECWIGCFERMLTVLFKDLTSLDIQKIEEIMESYYFKWNEDYQGICCEEYILENIPKKDKIVAVIYEEEDEEYE